MIDIVIILVKNIHKNNTFRYDGKKEIKKPEKNQSSLSIILSFK